jgi:hypothetical protein
MDLFNPPKLFNYKIMIKDLDFSKFENPIIQVVWEDFAENFTQDKIKSVKHYFSKKYNTTNVNVLTKAKNVESETMQSIDVSVNIADTQYQLDLITNYLKSKGHEDKTDDVLNINRSTTTLCREALSRSGFRWCVLLQQPHRGSRCLPGFDRSTSIWRRDE